MLDGNADPLLLLCRRGASSLLTAFDRLALLRFFCTEHIAFILLQVSSLRLSNVLPISLSYLHPKCSAFQCISCRSTPKIGIEHLLQRTPCPRSSFSASALLTWSSRAWIKKNQSSLLLVVFSARFKERLQFLVYRQRLYLCDMRTSKSWSTGAAKSPNRTMGEIELTSMLLIQVVEKEGGQGPSKSTSLNHDMN